MSEDSDARVLLLEAGAAREGVGLYHLTQKGDQRCSTAEAFDLGFTD